MEAFDNFYRKNLDTDMWSVHNVFIDAKFLDRVNITLKALEPTVLYDEYLNKRIDINKGDYIKGYLCPVYEYMIVLLYIKHNCIADLNISNVDDFTCTDCHKILTASLKDVTIYSFHGVDFFKSSVPDKYKSMKLYWIERQTRKSKKMLNAEILWNPFNGSKYFEMISDPDFRKRWNMN